jgi:uncharacterized damage-inducible protein DinB
MIIQSVFFMDPAVSKQPRRTDNPHKETEDFMRDHFKMFAAYNRWANDRLYQAVSDLTPEEFNTDKGAFFGSLCGTLNHVLLADRIWMKRFTGTGDVPARLDGVLYPEFDDLSNARRQEDERIFAWIASLTDEQLAAEITYTPITNPVTITQSLTPTLFHFFNHQTHHRGQAHMTLTAIGKPSLALDLIYFLRSEDGAAYA